MADRLISTTVTAERLGVTDQTVRRWIGSGRLPARRIARNYQIDIRDIEALEASAQADGLTDHVSKVDDAITDHIAKVVAAAPPLSDDQIARITTILHASRGTSPALSRTA